MSSDENQKPKKAVFVLEDEDFVRDAWVEALRRAMPDVYVSGASSPETAGDVIRRAEEERYEIVLVLVDQVLKGDRDAGIEFLRQFRQSHPDAQRVMFSGQSSRDDIQRFLDEGLVHHFQSKSAFADQTELPDAFLKKMQAMVEGRWSGNIRDPDAEDRFKKLLDSWIAALPDGEETDIRFVSGRTIKARDILHDAELMEKLRQGYATSRLDLLVLEEGDEEQA